MHGNMTFKGRVVAVLVGLLATTTLLEVSLRILYREEALNGNYWGIGAFVQDADLGYRHAPGFRGYAYRENVFDSFFEISRDGLRQRNVETQAQYPKRLLLLGDSMTVGLGVNEDEGFAHLIQTTLNPHGIGVINGAQTGYGVEQEVKFGMSLAQKYRPDAIVINVFPGNDIKNDFLKKYKNIEVRYGYRLPKDRLLPLLPFDFLRTHSYIWLRLSIDERIANWRSPRMGSRRMKHFEDLITKDPKAAVQPTLDALWRLKEFCAAVGIKLGVMLIPTKKGKQVADGHLRDALVKEAIPFLDLHGKLSAKEDYYSGDGHLNKHGHEKAAAFLATFVKNSIRITRGQLEISR